MNRLRLSLFFAASLVACDDRQDAGGPPSEPDLYCQINWSGALATDSSAFSVRACWNGRCSNDIAIQLAQADAGAIGTIDAGCVPMPTTPGGLPSGCRPASPQTSPFTPQPGCSTGEIADQFSVQACARTGSEGGKAFSVILLPSSPNYPADGGRAALTIVTSTGTSLVASETDIAPAAGTAPCRGADVRLLNGSPADGGNDAG